MTSIDTLREQLWNDEWIFVFPNLNEKYIINVFDDEYQEDMNEWIKFGEFKGETAIFNYYNNDIIIKNISTWKLTLM